MASVAYAECHKLAFYAECCYARCYYTECHSAKIFVKVTLIDFNRYTAFDTTTLRKAAVCKLSHQKCKHIPQFCFM